MIKYFWKNIFSVKAVKVMFDKYYFKKKKWQPIKEVELEEEEGGRRKKEKGKEDEEEGRRRGRRRRRRRRESWNFS